MYKNITLPPFVDLRAQFDYCEDTGRLFHRRVINEKRRCQDQAGTVVSFNRNVSYRTLVVEYPNGKTKKVFAHRVVWKLVTGEEPPTEIDHIDGNGLNNRWDNLRDGSHGENSRNMALSKRNTSGYNGIRKQRNRWAAVFREGGKDVYLGSFDSKKEAAEVARKARLERGYTERHGLPRKVDEWPVKA